jgi:DNA invertase Pin-like site-specific DNA recombinase
MGDLQDIVRAIRVKGADLRATDQAIGPSTAAGKAFFDEPGVFAEFATNLRRERRSDGIANAKVAEIYKGKSRPAFVPVDRSRLLMPQVRGRVPSPRRPASRMSVTVSVQDRRQQTDAPRSQDERVPKRGSRLA